MIDISDQQTLITKATRFATDKHRGQTRKDAARTPYINHPLAVARLLEEVAGVQDAHVIAAALLHDTVEDTDATVDEIGEEFGMEVRDIVIEVTDDKSLPSAKRKQLQIENAAGLSHAARLVKLADKICNLQDILASPPVHWSLERKREYFAWAKAVVDQIRGAHAGLEGLFDDIYLRKP